MSTVTDRPKMGRPLKAPSDKHPNRIRILREIAGLDQTELADRTGFKQATVSRHELGNRSLDGLAIERYSRLFGVTPYELFVRMDHELEDDKPVPADDDPVYAIGTVATLTQNRIADIRALVDSGDLATAPLGVGIGIPLSELVRARIAGILTIPE